MVQFNPSDDFAAIFSGGGAGSSEADALLKRIKNGLGDAWLDTPNAYLGFQTPRDALKADNVRQVKDLLTSMSASALS